MSLRPLSIPAIVLALLASAVVTEQATAADTLDEAVIETSWARHLFDFIPAIDACIAASPEPAIVLRAWPMNRGMVGMRLADVLGAHWHCVADMTGVEVAMFDPADEPAEPPVEPVFTRAPGAPPPGGCYEHDEVEDAEGAVLGWLSTNVC